eukprot:gene525-1001_t
MFSILTVVVFICLAIFTQAFFKHSAFQSRISKSSLNMMFGQKAAPKGKITITVDGNKVIECAEPVNMRKQLMANKVDVYPFKGKLSNCGGAGICGTCAVRVLEGGNNLNPPSKNELNTLKGKPADIRLSCCAKVNGPISIKTKP